MIKYHDEDSYKDHDRVKLLDIIKKMHYEIENLEEENIYLKDKLDFHGIPFKEILK